MYGGTSVPAPTRASALRLRLTPSTCTGAGIGTADHQTWGIRGAFNHNWDPYWNSALYGAYAAVQYGNVG